MGRHQQDPATGADTNNRMLFEIRVVGDRWFLDSYIQSGSESIALMNREALHPLRVWYHVASVYDGKVFRNYVDGVEQGAALLSLAPHRGGHASVGVRINKVFYFKGTVHMARFSRSALPPSAFCRNAFGACATRSVCLIVLSLSRSTQGSAVLL